MFKGLQLQPRYQNRSIWFSPKIKEFIGKKLMF